MMVFSSTPSCPRTSPDIILHTTARWTRPTAQRPACPSVGFRSVFFFSSRRRHTRCSRDWSSDVCSSDLREMLVAPVRRGALLFGKCLGGATVATLQGSLMLVLAGLVHVPYSPLLLIVVLGIRRASCRERGEISVGSGSVKKKKEVTMHRR